MKRSTKSLCWRRKLIVYCILVSFFFAILFNQWVLIFKSSSSSQQNERLESHHFAITNHLAGLLPDGVRFFSSSRPESWFQCVGDNFLPNAWTLKSCQFEHLCWRDGTFTLHPAVRQRNITILSPYARSSTNPQSHHVSLTATMPSWITQQRYRWFPNVVDEATSTISEPGYYELPASTVWIPTVLDDALLQRPSLILFDVLLPVYTLLTMFGLEDQSILLTPVETLPLCLTNNRTDKSNSCYPAVLEPYLKLLNMAPFPNHVPPHGLLCGRRAAAGLGALSDHGNKRHGERAADYQNSQNVGRGASLWKFRQYLLRNAGVTETFVRDHNPARLVFSVMDESASNMAPQAAHLAQHTKNNFPGLQIHHVNLSKLSLMDQISLASNTTFWVAHVGEASVPAFFLPRSGTLILYYDKKVSTAAGKQSNRPAMLHWDLWNHASHLTVHWLPLASDDHSTSTTLGHEALQQIVKLQLDFLHQQTKNHFDTGIHSSAMALGEKLSWIAQGYDFSSSAHCLGDNFVPFQAPCYRTCYYHHLCLDVSHREFQLGLSESQNRLQRSIDALDDGFLAVATDMNQTVMEGRNVRIVTTTPWAPSVVNASAISSFFALPDDILWIPFTLDVGFAGNPGHLFWDFFLPFYSILAMYGETHKKRLLVTSLDDACRSTPKCGDLVEKFLPLMGSNQIFTTDKLQIDVSKDTIMPQSVARICAKHGAAGIGMLTDHGSTRHGQGLDDYKRVQNTGKGAHFYAFRNFMLRNLGIDDDRFTVRLRQGVLFSIFSSANLPRRKSFAKQIDAARRGLAREAFVSGVELARFPLRDQIQAILQTSVFISTVGGSTATAMFLPRHSSLILYFSSEESFVGGTRKKDFPVMMDFDFWNNAAYIRVHWLPTGSMDEEFHLEFLVDLIRSELKQTERFRRGAEF